MNLNVLNGTMSWISIFILSWLLILGKIASNWTTWGFFVFFMIVALIAGAYIRDEKLAKNNVSRPTIITKGPK